MRKIGDRVWWRGVSRDFSGEIKGFHKTGYIVSLDSGKCVIVGEESIQCHNAHSDAIQGS